MLSSPVEWAIVAGAALLLFGPKKFPEIGKALGQGLGNFKRALNDAQDQVVQGMEEAEKAGKPKAPAKIARDPAPAEAEPDEKA